MLSDYVCTAHILPHFGPLLTTFIGKYSYFLKHTYQCVRKAYMPKYEE